MAVLVLYNSNFKPEPFDELKTNLEAINISCDVRRLEGDGVFAGIEAYLLTGISIWVLGEFFRPILRGLGTDTYEILKAGIIKIYASEGKSRTILYGSKGKIDRDFPYSMTMSLQSDVNNGERVKLLIQKDITEEKFEEVIDIFFNFLENYHSGELAPSLLKGLEEARSVSRLKLVAVDLDKMELVFPDPIGEQKINAKQS